MTALLVIGIYLVVIIAGVTIYVKKQEAKLHTTDNFMMGGKTMSAPVVGITMALTILGAVHVFGLMEMGFMMGAVTMWFPFIHVVIICIGGFVTGAWLRRYGLDTIPEFVGRLFGPYMRVMCIMATVLVVWGFLTLECQGMGIVVNVFSGWSISTGIFISAIAGLLYVLLAGVKEIGYINTINTFIMYAGLIVGIIILGYNLPGGNWDAVNAFYKNTDKEWMMSLMGTATIMKTFTLSLSLSVLFSQSVNQTMLHATAGAKDEKTVKRATWIAAPVNGMFGCFTVAIGFAASTIPEFAELGPKVAGTAMIMNLLPGWVVGWLLASFVAAIISSFAMHSLATATIFVKDIYVDRYNPLASEKQQTIMVRIFIILLGGSASVIAIWLPTILAAVGWVSSFLAPFFYFLFAGLYWKRSQAAGVITILVAWLFNIIWSFTNLWEVWGFATQDVYAYFTVGITVVLGTVLTFVLPGKEAYRKQLAREKALAAAEGREFTYETFKAA